MTNFERANAVAWTQAKTLEVMQWAEQHFGLNDFVRLGRVRVNTRFGRSRGGVKHQRGLGYTPWVSLQIGWHLSKNKFGEYATISHHPIIGDFQGEVHECITVLIAHEVAHAVDYWGMYGRREHNIDDRDLRGFYPVCDARHRTRGGHGVRWQKIYAILRNKFVAKGVTDPVIKTKKIKVVKLTRSSKPRQKPQRQITTECLSLSGGRTQIIYSHKGERVAYGLPWRYGFRIYSIDNYQTPLVELENGRRARAWILENLVK